MKYRTISRIPGKSFRLTTTECDEANCGTIMGDGCHYPRHGGNTRLVKVDGGKLAQCQGCSRIFTQEQVRALRVSSNQFLFLAAP
jgi:hypothetical protein